MGRGGDVPPSTCWATCLALFGVAYFHIARWWVGMDWSLVVIDEGPITRLPSRMKVARWKACPGSPPSGMVYLVVCSS